MSDDLEKRRREWKLQLAGDQIREILRAGDNLERRTACDRIFNKAASLNIDVGLLLTQLRVLAEATGRSALSDRLKQLMLDADLEMLAMETVFEGFPEDWNGDE